MTASAHLEDVLVIEDSQEDSVDECKDTGAEKDPYCAEELFDKLEVELSGLQVEHGGTQAETGEEVAEKDPYGTHVEQLDLVEKELFGKAAQELSNTQGGLRGIDVELVERELYSTQVKELNARLEKEVFDKQVELSIQAEEELNPQVAKDILVGGAQAELFSIKDELNAQVGKDSFVDGTQAELFTKQTEQVAKDSFVGGELSTHVDKGSFMGDVRSTKQTEEANVQVDVSGTQVELSGKEELNAQINKDNFMGSPQVELSPKQKRNGQTDKDIFAGGTYMELFTKEEEVIAQVDEDSFAGGMQVELSTKEELSTQVDKDSFAGGVELSTKEKLNTQLDKDSFVGGMHAELSTKQAQDSFTGGGAQVELSTNEELKTQAEKELGGKKVHVEVEKRLFDKELETQAEKPVNTKVQAGSDAEAEVAKEIYSTSAQNKPDTAKALGNFTTPPKRTLDKDDLPAISPAEDW